MRTRISANPDSLKKLAKGGLVTSRKSIASVVGQPVRDANEVLLQNLAGSVSLAPINGYSSLVNFAPTANKPIHRWFWYREGYSTDLVKELVKELPRGSTVLDPFCGAGTTLLVARDMGLSSLGFDVNPISTLVSKVKTTTLTPEEQAEIAKQVRVLMATNSSMTADAKPAFKIIDKIFDAEILQALLIFRRAIKAIASPKVRDFLFVAWLSILEGVSNAYKEGNGLKYKNRKRTDEGYIKINLESWKEAALPHDKFGFVKGILLKKIEEMQHDLQYMPKQPSKVTVIEDSAENISSHLSPNSISMAIFSPPYCNCFNYFKMYKVELWMGEFVTSYDELKQLNRRGLRSHVETVLKKPDDVIEPASEKFAALLDGQELWDKRIPNAVRGYFIDMAKVLEQLHTVLKPSAKCVIVVGNSAYGGVVIPTDALLANIATRIGFKVEKLAVARPLTTSSQQQTSLGNRKSFLRESLLILIKEDQRLIDHKLVNITEIPQQDKQRHGQVFAIKNNGLTAGTHKFHRYPGKFIPHIPRWALQRYLDDKPHNGVILDPFCGSGTTLVEAALHGVQGFGIDVDPIARLVSRVKTTAISNRKLNAAIEDITNKIHKRSKATFKPTIPTLEHWFTKEAIEELGAIRGAIDEYQSEKALYDFLILCLASIIRRVSNADNQTQKTYVSHTKPKIPEAAKPLFLTTLNDYAARLASFSKECPKPSVDILDNCDARNFSSIWHKKALPKVDLIITSPPYLNSVDYIYNQMAEYFWIGDLFELETQTKQNGYKRNYIGTTRVEKEAYRELQVTGLSEIDRVVEAIYRKNPKNSYIVGKYFIDMISHFREATEILDKNGHYISVVGDSLVSGESILVHKLVAQCAEISGLSLKGVFGYEIRNRHMRFPRMGRGGIVRYDWVLELKKR